MLTIRKLPSLERTRRPLHLPSFSVGRTVAFGLVAMLIAVSAVSLFIGPNERGGPRSFVMNADGSGLRRITSDFSDSFAAPSWSPDGRFLVIGGASEGPGKPAYLWVVELSTGKWSQLTNGTSFDFEPAWSPDGSRIAFLSADGAIAPPAIMSVNVDGSDLRQLTRSGRQEWPPVWSPDGQRIAFSSGRNGPPHIYVMNADGSDQRMLEAAGDGVVTAWSPNGRSLAFWSPRFGQSDIFFLDIETGLVTRVTDHIANDGNPTWSPDGDQLLFQSNRDQAWQIFKMNLDGSGLVNLSKIARQNVDGPARWSPDGREIAFTASQR